MGQPQHQSDASGGSRYAPEARVAYLTEGGWVVVEILGGEPAFELLKLISLAPIDVGDAVEPFDGIGLENLTKGNCPDAAREGDYASLGEAKAAADMLEADYRQRYPNAP